MRLRMLIFIAPLFLLSCKTKQAAMPVAPVEIKVPVWVSSRPNNSFKYVGIGFSEKSKPDYQMEAKKNALYDLASEIKVNISSNSVLYTVQNNNSFNENFNSLIKLSNSDNLEGYTQVDAYENEKQYWVYYQLDKQEYANRKAEKKQQTILKAVNLINASFYDEKNKDFSSSLKKRIQAFGVLAPYLAEDLAFDPQQANGLKNVFDLTNLIQGQLQSISIVQHSVMPVLKPYQPGYQLINLKLELKNKVPLQNFPLLASAENDRITVQEQNNTNQAGEMQLKVNSVEPVNQVVAFSINPDINGLMGSDSIGQAGITLLKQFISTPSLKAQAQVSNITLFISCRENNLGQPTGLNSLESMIVQKLQTPEIKLVSSAAEADYLVECSADTQEDLSSAVLDKNYGLRLCRLLINLSLRNRGGETLYKSQLNEIYGYANLVDKAGLNAYASPKVSAQMAEAIFFLKRKMVVY